VQNVKPYLWFDTEAEDAAKFYVSVFKNSKINHVSHYGEGGPRPAGMVMVVTFELDGCAFLALNGGPQEDAKRPVAFFVDCETQAEIDHAWDRLSEHGEPGRCGWITDKYGITWNLVPSILPDWLGSDDEKKADAAMAAMLQMGKLDIAELQRAYDAG